MAALRPTGDARAVSGGGPGTASKLGRWGDFTLVTDGAGQGFVRGPALLRCSQRWRLRARAGQVRCLPPLWREDSCVDVPLHEALRCSAAHVLAAEVSMALTGSGGAGGGPSVHLAGSIWDATGERPPKRRRVGEAPSSSSADAQSAAEVADGCASGFFAVRRWDALMDPRVPWRLRAAALVYHHHGVRGCTHAGVRAAARDFICSRTRHDERLRLSLLDPIEG